MVVLIKNSHCFYSPKILIIICITKTKNRDGGLVRYNENGIIK